MDSIENYKKSPEETNQGQTSTALEKGRFDLDDLPKILHRILKNRMTARLRLIHDAQTYKSLYFSEGELITVLSIPFEVKECLGRLFQMSGLLKPEDVINSLKRKQASGGLQGEELIRMGKIRPDKLQEILRMQISLKLTPVFEWQEGSYELTKLPSVPGNISGAGVNSARLLFGLLWKYYPDEKIREGLKDKNELWIGKPTELPFNPESFLSNKQFQKFWSAVLEKDIPFKRLLVVSNLKGEETSRALWLLHIMGMLIFLSDTREDRVQVRIRDLAEKLKFIEKENHFDLIGVHWTSNDAQISRAYEKIRAEYEQKITSAGEIEKSLLEKTLGFIRRAYEAVNTRDKRQAYRRRVYDPSFIEVTAELFRQKGESYLFTKEEFAQTVEEMESSVEVLDPDGETMAVLGLAYFLTGYKNNTAKTEKGRQYLQRGYNMDPKSEITNLCMGMMYKKEQKYPKAKTHYEKILEVNSGNRFAKMEIREIDSGKTQEDRDAVVKEFLDNREKTRAKAKKEQKEKQPT